MPIRTAKAIPIPAATAGGKKAANVFAKKKPAAGAKAVTGQVVTALYPQEASNWCWAACAQMVANSNAVGVPAAEVPAQPTVVSRQTGSVQNVTQTGRQIAALYPAGVIGPRVGCRHTAGGLFQQYMIDELAADRPMEVGVVFPGGGHVVTVVGFTEQPDGSAHYIVFDPAKGPVVVAYNELASAAWLGVSGRWSESFHGFSRM